VGSTPTKGRESLGEVLEFMRLVWALHHGLQATSKRMAVQLGVTGPQRLVLRLVGRRPGISAGELADLLRVHPSTLTGVLRRLEERGFIARKADPEDRRRAVLTLTSAGKSIDAVRGGTVEAAVRRVIEKMPDEDVEATRRMLVHLAHELGGDEES
jgi:MarR family transcriptional regulator, organic hydroperoxide resistance regulator